MRKQIVGLMVLMMCLGVIAGPKNCFGASGAASDFLAAGSPNELDYGDSTMLDEATSFSIFIHAQFDDLSVQTQRLVSKWTGSASTRSWIFTTDEPAGAGSDELVVAAQYLSSAVDVFKTSNANLVDDVKYHIGVAWKDSDFEFWRDGTNLGKTTVADQTVVEITDHTSTLYIGGKDSDGGGNEFNGRGAFAHVYRNKFFETWETNEIYWKPGMIADSLEMFAPMWGTSSPEEDLTGNGHNGTVTNVSSSSDGFHAMMGNGWWV